MARAGFEPRPCWSRAGALTIYADDLAILHYANDWQALAETLTQDMVQYPPTFANGNSSSVQQRLCRQPSIPTIRRHDMMLTSLSTNRPHHFVLNPLILT